MTRLHHIPGIKNPIEWDGFSTPRPIRLRGTGYIAAFVDSHRPHRTAFNLRDESGRRLQISAGRLIFMLRNGVSLQQCRELNTPFFEDGLPSDSHPRRVQYSIFQTLDECERTIAVIRDLQSGDPTSLYQYIQAQRDFIESYAWRNYRISRERLDFLFDQTLAEVEQRLTTCYFRHLQKISVYFLQRLYNLHMRLLSEPRPLPPVR